jgi:DNA polymerase III alpha subunit
MLSWVKKVKRDGSDEEWQVWEHLKHNVKLVNKRDVPKFRKELSAEQLASVRAASFAVPMNESNLTPAAVEYIREQAHLGDEYAELDKGDSVICGGEIVKVDIKTASNGREYANIRLVFESDDWMVKLWEQELATYRHLLFVGSEIMVAGRKDIWNDFESVVVDEMVSVEEFFTSDEEEAA